jgi:thioredoxin 1
MKSKFIVFASSLFLLIGVWYVSTQDSRAGVEDKKEKKSIEATHSDHVEDVVGKKAFAEVLKNNDIVLVDFHATWCPPCRKLKPTINGIANKYHPDVKVAAVDTDKNQDVARSHGVSGIPDVRLFQDGKQIHKWVGWQPAANYTSKIDQVLKQKAGEEKPEEAPAKSEKPTKEETES